MLLKFHSFPLFFFVILLPIISYKMCPSLNGIIGEERELL